MKTTPNGLPGLNSPGIDPDSISKNNPIDT